ncbi:hypothetical protein [Nesterenkonia rhizosphaerae]|uniref:Uncharacterized protein n=1 Tax=Nesterenkonia rhizosphaerae TaxID=1348272 RepID=A0ABP9FZD6_9MICC
MAQNWTTDQDVLDRWTAEDQPDSEKLTTKIGQAERAIRREFTTMAARLKATDHTGDKVEPDLQALIADVVADLVQESFTNPLGLRSIQDVEGPWSQQRTIAGDSPGKMILTRDHKRLLSPPASGSRMKTVDLGLGSHIAGQSRLHRNAHGIVVTPEGWPV